jgi:hypothetical protein
LESRLQPIIAPPKSQISNPKSPPPFSASLPSPLLCGHPISAVKNLHPGSIPLLTASLLEQNEPIAKTKSFCEATRHHFQLPPWTAVARCRFPVQAACCREQTPFRSIPHLPPPCPHSCPSCHPWFPSSPFRTANREQQPSGANREPQPSGARQPAKGCPQGEVGGPRQTATSSRAERDSQPKAARRARSADLGKPRTKNRPPTPPLPSHSPSVIRHSPFPAVAFPPL